MKAKAIGILERLGLVLSLLMPAPGLAASGAGGRYGGPAPIVPRWAFEPWVGESNGNTRIAAERLIEAYRARDIPAGALLINGPWSTAYNDFTWDTQRYPEPDAMIAGFHRDNVRVILWLNGLVTDEGRDVSRGDPAYEEVHQRGFAVNGGASLQWRKGTGRHLDFTNPAASEWWGARMDHVSRLGVDGWKVDQGEAHLPPVVHTAVGQISRSDFKLHYYAAIHRIAIRRNPGAITLARAYSHQDGWAAAVADCTIGWSGNFSGD